MQTPEQIREHYEIEKGLADQLRRSDKTDRALLYPRLYDELMRRVPHHPMLQRRSDARERAAAVAVRMGLVGRFLRSDTVFLEVGAGDCTFTREVAQRVKRCYAIDVSRELVELGGPSNMQTILSDGCSIPVPEASVTLAYSNQLMEHVHPDDAFEQLCNLYRALVPGGRYVCTTPNRLNGPHDVSQHFDTVASGFHLKEYTYTELAALFHGIGFRRLAPYAELRLHYVRVPLALLVAFEWLLERLPRSVSRRIAKLPVIRKLLFISLVATK
ncbi:MAG: methyltransferase domain-containing protein [Steroidobacteraceae bacterium]